MKKLKPTFIILFFLLFILLLNLSVDRNMENDDFGVVKKKYRKYGLIKNDTTVLIPYIYDLMFFVRYDFIIVKKDEKFGVIDVENKKVIPFKYDEIYSWSSNKCKSSSRQFAKNNNKVGLMNEDGEFLTELEYDAIWETGGCSFYTIRNSKRGLIDENGNTILKNNFDRI